MTVPDAASFDSWYDAIEASQRWDAFLQQRLGLPSDTQSSGYLSGAGLLEVTERLGLTPGSALVELGCGRGGYGMAVTRATGARLVGVDFSSAALAAARRQAARLRLEDRVEFRLGDLTATGLAAACADAVLCVDAFHFAPSTAEAAAESRRLLRPDGRLVLASWEPVTPGDPGLPYRLRHLDLRRDLAAAGFVDLRAEVRPAWSATELALWQDAVALRPDGDPAVVALVEEARALIPLAPSLRRVLVTGRSPVGAAGGRGGPR